ncbi:MAG: NTP transferase domain-containing protein [Lachnospiraceae bacterium]|jgi:glucose-1-phosphate thymidylyltransferase|nr:NTP transferase domain-containing protein [Lachnospiraceae bacterium]
MKGIILAGGTGTRLHPLTLVTSKQLLPVYDKPMIFYPLSVLKDAGIREVLIISTPMDTPRFEILLGDGKEYGLQLSYAIQPTPGGLAQAFTLGKDFIGTDSCAMILGDNIFYGRGLAAKLKRAVKEAERAYKEGQTFRPSGNIERNEEISGDNVTEQLENGAQATVFAYKVSDPERFGVVGFDEKGRPESIEEKPKNPKSNYAVTGLYFYPAGVSERAEKLKPSKRGELEITDLTNTYLKEGRLRVEKLGRGYKWIDAGTIESLRAAGEFIRDRQRRSGKVIGDITGTTT